MISSFISEIVYYLPEKCIDTVSLEYTLQENSSYIIPKGLIEMILGVEHRYRVEREAYSSTMSVHVIQKLKKKFPM